MEASDMDLINRIAKFGVLSNGCLVFFMQVGFVVLEVGIGRAKNIQNILLKNMLNVMVTGLCWWAYGYALAYGKSARGVVGRSMFFYEPSLKVSQHTQEQRPWFFSWTFLLASNTIVSGCLAERTALEAYLVYTAALATLSHPLAAHWSWSPVSWLRQISSATFLDFAGGAAVHLVGGMTGLIGAVMCGPRIGRFGDNSQLSIPGHEMAYCVMGTMMLWFGWYGFNCGSTYLYTATNSVRRVAMNTTMSASAGGLANLLSSALFTGSFPLVGCCNGILSGLVVITPLCGFVDTGPAMAAGAIAGMLYQPLSHLLVRCRVDDPLDSSVVHMGSGVLGVLLVGVIAKPEHVQLLYGASGGGILYTSRGWVQLAVQLLGVVSIGSLAAVVALCTFGALSWAGRLRVVQVVELAGIDMWEHGGPAYPEIQMLTRRGSPGVC